MPITFTVTDNGAGTGATAHIAGTVITDANAVYVGKATGAVGAVPFTLGGNRVGDGNVPLAVANGLWWAYLTVNGAFTAQYYFGASNGLDAVATRVRRSVCDTIRLLTIPPALHVYEQAFPDQSNIEFPCVLATVEGVQESDEQGLSTRDDIGRPCRVGIYDRIDPREAKNKLPLYEFWREKVWRCFINQQLAGVPESKSCRIEPYIIIDPGLPQYEHFVTGLMVRATTREPRGVGV